MGAIGGAVINGGCGVLIGSLVSCGMFNGNFSEKKSNSNGMGGAVSYVASSVLTGLVGYGIMNSGHYDTVMELGQTAAAFAVGGAVTMIPVTCGVMCIGLPLLLAAAAITANTERNNTQAPVSQSAESLGESKTNFSNAV